MEEKIMYALEKYFEVNPNGLQEEYLPVIFMHPKIFWELRFKSQKLYSLKYGKHEFNGFKVFIDRDVDENTGFIISCKKTYMELEYYKLRLRLNEMFE